MRFLKVLHFKNVDGIDPSQEVIDRGVRAHVQSLIQRTCLSSICGYSDCDKPFTIRCDQIQHGLPREFTTDDFAFSLKEESESAVLTQVYPFFPWLVNGEKTTPNPLFDSPDLVRLITTPKKDTPVAGRITETTKNISTPEHGKGTLVYLEAEVSADQYDFGFYRTGNVSE